MEIQLSKRELLCEIATTMPIESEYMWIKYLQKQTKMQEVNMIFVYESVLDPCGENNILY